ncbi:hypothetical protein [uncultured Clostridium sp.]|uniref:hypothetical protein n=1 Tax=uncultured Clostridium sp. TaxID=59620 RepID=UPI0025ECC7BE|nr:hypothetical protein [uncultured Clostridium sp.]
MNEIKNSKNIKYKIVKKEVVYNFKKEEMILRDFLAKVVFYIFQNSFFAKIDISNYMIINFP